MERPRVSEPDVASDYDDRGVQAAHAVLVEIGLVLGAHRDAIVVIGGSVPSLLLPGAKPSHIGSLDIDLNLNTEKLAEHGYADLVDKLEKAGYQRNVEGLKPFQLKRVVNLDDGGEPIAVIVDLLMPKGAKTQKNRPQHVEGLRVQEIDGGDIALQSNLKMMIAGTMPDKRQYKAEMLVASIPALLVMKGYALVQRDKKKDAYDIYFCVREFEGGIEALAAQCKALMGDAVVLQGYKNIALQFEKEDGFGPETVRRFLADSESLGDMTEDQIRTDAFRQVSAWLKAIGLKE